MTPTLHVNAALDRDRVDAIHRRVADAMAAPAALWTADEISEALLIYLCQIMHGAPDDGTRFVLADGALEFIERNCGIDRTRLRMLRAVERDARERLHAAIAEHDGAEPSPVYEAPRDLSIPVRVRGVFRDAGEPRSLGVALTERPTDDDIRSLHEFLREWEP